jgi:hypothetical protein
MTGYVECFVVVYQILIRNLSLLLFVCIREVEFSFLLADIEILSVERGVVITYKQIILLSFCEDIFVQIVTAG